MKPTDEERREVARRLRGVEPVELDGGEFVDCGEVETELGLRSDDGAWYEADAVRRLADLIEPAPERTCRVIDHGTAVRGGLSLLQCSSCGALNYAQANGGAWRHCPYCGAKVVSE